MMFFYFFALKRHFLKHLSTPFVLKKREAALPFGTARRMMVGKTHTGPFDLGALVR